jgi:hypothetical protein
MKYLFLKGNSAPKMYHDMSVTLVDKHPSCSPVKNWVSRLRTGYLSTEYKEHSGRSIQVTFPEKVDATPSMVLRDPRLSVKKIAKTLVIL